MVSFHGAVLLKVPLATHQPCPRSSARSLLSALVASARCSVTPTDRRLGNEVVRCGRGLDYPGEERLGPAVRGVLTPGVTHAAADDPLL